MILILIPVHNRKEFTRNCLLSLRNQSYKEFKIVVIDDGSTDGTEEMIENEFPEVHIIKGDGNLWWAAATNLGVKFALENNAEYILTLNNDTITSEDFLEKMMYRAGQAPNSLLGSFALDIYSHNPVYGGQILNWKTASYTNLLEKLKPDDRKGIHSVSHYHGRGLLIPAIVFRTIGYYDAKNFPQAVADDDFAHRAAKAGYKIYCNYDSILYVYPEESGDVKLRQKKSIINYYNHLFSRKGGGNLKYFTVYAIKNCPTKDLLLFLPIGIIRRIFGYLLDWFEETIRKN